MADFIAFLIIVAMSVAICLAVYGLLDENLDLKRTRGDYRRIVYELEKEKRALQVEAHNLRMEIKTLVRWMEGTK